MKVLALTAGIILASILSSHAQIAVEVVLDQEQFLLDESLPVKVRITNRSGQTLTLGQESDWLTFAIRSQDSYSNLLLKEVPVVGEQQVESSMTATRRVDLMPYFDLSKTGQYTVEATVRIKQLKAEIVSAPKTFELSRGTRLWEQAFGVPLADGTSESRKYALQQANYKKRLMLYVRLTDLDEHRVFNVLPAGALVSFSHPEAQIDRASKLHLLFQTGARSFLYQVISPEGRVLLRQTHDYANTRPVLRSGEDGKPFVSGGVRRLTTDDLPAPAPTASTNDVTTPKL